MSNPYRTYDTLDLVDDIARMEHELEAGADSYEALQHTAAHLELAQIELEQRLLSSERNSDEA